jgi:hypothetical protein
VKKYEINKYPPSLFTQARFLREDWTSWADIGTSRSNGLALTRDEYLRVEDLDVTAASSVASACGASALRAHGVEFWNDESQLLADLGLDDVLDGSATPIDGEELTAKRLENAMRRCLREVAWLELGAKPRLLLHFGYDLRLIIASASPLEPLLDAIRASGLFVYDSQAALPILEQWAMTP